MGCLDDWRAHIVNTTPKQISTISSLPIWKGTGCKNPLYIKGSNMVRYDMNIMIKDVTLRFRLFAKLQQDTIKTGSIVSS